MSPQAGDSAPRFNLSVDDFLRYREARRANLVVSYCRLCGLVIAASPDEEKLAIAERIHHCPVYLDYFRLKKKPGSVR